MTSAVAESMMLQSGTMVADDRHPASSAQGNVLEQVLIGRVQPAHHGRGDHQLLSPPFQARKGANWEYRKVRVAHSGQQIEGPMAVVGRRARMMERAAKRRKTTRFKD